MKLPALMRTPLLSILVLLLLGTSGCETASLPPIQQTSPFNETDFRAYVSPGTAKITGQSFLKTEGGDVKFGAGNKVELIPATPYTRERAQIAMSAPYSLRDRRDPRLAKYVRTTIADAQGNFEFNNVPAGEYVLICEILWRYASGSGSFSTGGQAIAFASVAEGQTQKVVLTR